MVQFKFTWPKSELSSVQVRQKSELMNWTELFRSVLPLRWCSQIHYSNKEINMKLKVTLFLRNCCKLLIFRICKTIYLVVSSESPVLTHMLVLFSCLYHICLYYIFIHLYLFLCTCQKIQYVPSFMYLVEMYSHDVPKIKRFDLLLCNLYVCNMNNS